jgi:regulator of protease activity HflC (stomatin/prohibitin superfamily)
MPITLEKLLSPTAETSFEWDGEVVNLVYAPMRYTGEMQDFAVRLDDEATAERAKVAELREQADTIIAEAGKDEAAKAAAEAKAAALRADAMKRETRMDFRDRAALRDFLATMLVSWDVMDGRKPLRTDRKTLDRLPDMFLKVAFVMIGTENSPDPQKAPTSNGS